MFGVLFRYRGLAKVVPAVAMGTKIVDRVSGETREYWYNEPDVSIVLEVEAGEEYIIVNPVAELTHAAIDTYDDHRMAMCFSLVALSDTPVTINDPGCTSKTFPDYFDKLKMLSQ